MYMRFSSLEMDTTGLMHDRWAGPGSKHGHRAFRPPLPRLCDAAGSAVPVWRVGPELGWACWRQWPSPYPVVPVRWFGFSTGDGALLSPCTAALAGAPLGGRWASLGFWAWAFPPTIPQRSARAFAGLLTQDHVLVSSLLKDYTRGQGCPSRPSPTCGQL